MQKHQWKHFIEMMKNKELWPYLCTCNQTVIAITSTTPKWLYELSNYYKYHHNFRNIKMWKVHFRIDKIDLVNINNLYYYRSWESKSLCSSKAYNHWYTAFFEKNQKNMFRITNTQTCTYYILLFYETDYLKVI